MLSARADNIFRTLAAIRLGGVMLPINLSLSYVTEESVIEPHTAPPSPESRASGPRVGIIGTGFMGQVHARAVQAAGGTVVAVAGSSAERARLGARAFHAERGAASVDELIAARDIDLVHVCVPNHLHSTFALATLAAGKHVVCEKPLAVDAQGAVELAAAADAAGVVAAVPFVYRFYPTVREARERVRRGDAGSVTLLHGSYLQDWLASPSNLNWRLDPHYGGTSRAFGDIGVHWCDLAEFVSGQRISRISSRLLTAFPSRPTPGSASDEARVETEDAATLLFETVDGAVGVVAISQVSHGRKNRLELSIDGTKASLTFNQEEPESLWIGRQDESTIIMRGSSNGSAPADEYNVLPPGHPQGYQDAFNAFVRDVFKAIDGHAPDGLPTFADGLRAARLTEAVLESARTETWTKV